MKPTNIILAMSVAAVLTACAAPYGWNKNAGEKVDQALADAKKTNAAKAAVPADVNQALLPPLQIPLPDGTAQVEPRFDFTVNNAPARQVFMGLVEGTRYSMMVHPEVNGVVSLNMKDATVPEAMDAIRRLYGYEYKRDGNRFFVLPRGMQTRMFPINYLNMNRVGRSDTRVSSGELTRGGATPSSNNSQSTAAGQTGGHPGNTGSNGNANIQVETESRTDFWKDLEATVKALIGTQGGRAVVANPQSGLLVVRAMPDELRVVEDFLSTTQTAVNRQVVLEAKVLEVQLSDRFQTGINWAQLGHVGGANVTTGQTGGGTVFGGTGASETVGSTGSLYPPGSGTLFSGPSASSFGGIFSLAIQYRSFAAFLELLQTQGNVQVLSSPRVATVNNQKALIKVGGDEFFVTGIKNSASGAVTATGAQVLTPEIELTPFFSGIALDVTPQIDDHNNIILHIHPAISDVVQRDKTLRISDQQYSLPLALSSVQESDNIVRASSGQVIVIGGLMKEGSTDDSASVPLLGDLPVVGNLFKHKKVTRIKRELVILLKPTVVEGAQTWTDMVDQSQGHIERLRSEK